jgi:sulfotransferase family protein
MFIPPGRPKEIHFFDDHWRKPLTPADAERYHAFFPRPHGGFAGEWTPRYMFDFWVPALLRRAAPDTKVLVMLRDPIERYASGIAFNLGRRRAPTNPVVAGEAMARGLYFQQLEWLLEHFDRAQVLVLQFERCLRDPHGELSRTYGFLGLDSGFVPPDLSEPKNETTWAVKQVPAATRRELEKVYRPDLARLGEAFPEIDLALWPTYTGEAARLSRSTV